MPKYDHLREFLSHNKWDELLQSLEQEAKKASQRELLNYLATIKGHYHKYLKDKRNGILSSEMEVVQYNKIQQSLLEAIQFLEDPSVLPHTLEQFQPKHKGKFRSAAWVLALCILVFVIGLLPVPWPRLVEAEIITPYLTLRLNKALDIAAGVDWYLTNLALDPVQSIEYPTIPALHDQNAMLLEIAGEALKLDQLNFTQAPTLLSLESNPPYLLLHSVVERIGLKVDLDSTGTIYANPLGWDSLITELTPLQMTAGPAPTLAIGLCDTCSFVMKNLPVDSLDFTWKNFERENEIASAIQSGWITLEGKKDSLRAGEFLRLEGLQHAQATIEKIGSSLRVRFIGKAGSIKTAFAGTIQSYRTNWLRYLFNNQIFAFYGGVFAWLFGVAWAIRQWWMGSQF